MNLLYLGMLYWGTAKSFEEAFFDCFYYVNSELAFEELAANFFLGYCESETVLHWGFYFNDTLVSWKIYDGNDILQDIHLN